MSPAIPAVFARRPCLLPSHTSRRSACSCTESLWEWIDQAKDGRGSVEGDGLRSRSGPSLSRSSRLAAILSRRQTEPAPEGNSLFSAAKISKRPHEGPKQEAYARVGYPSKPPR
jgi:hypothetical protein